MDTQANGTHSTFLTSAAACIDNSAGTYAAEGVFLSPEAVLPEQFFPHAGETPPMSGVRGILWAMVEDAIQCFQRQVLIPG